MIYYNIPPLTFQAGHPPPLNGCSYVCNNSTHKLFSAFEPNWISPNSKKFPGNQKIPIQTDGDFVTYLN